MENAHARYLRRSTGAASEYLRTQWGVEYSPATLAKLCCQGKGPITHQCGRIALHSPEALDAFARACIKPMQRRKHSQRAQNEAAAP